MERKSAREIYRTKDNKGVSTGQKYEKFEAEQGLMHTNPKTGKLSPCHARVHPCPWGGVGEHFADLESANYVADARATQLERLNEVGKRGWLVVNGHGEPTKRMQKVTKALLASEYEINRIDSMIEAEKAAVLKTLVKRFGNEKGKYVFSSFGLSYTPEGEQERFDLSYLTKEEFADYVEDKEIRSLFITTVQGKKIKLGSVDTNNEHTDNIDSIRKIHKGYSYNLAIQKNSGKISRDGEAYLGKLRDLEQARKRLYDAQYSVKKTIKEQMERRGIKDYKYGVVRAENRISVKKSWKEGYSSKNFPDQKYKKKVKVKAQVRFIKGSEKAS